jgi:glyoxylase-like metal-dependent hydrolase (beta-lactamase superfamily II)
MNRSFRRGIPVIVLGLVARAEAARSQVNYDTVQVRSIPAGTGVYMLTGVGGNIGLSIGPDAAFLVDDQYAPLSEKLLAAVRKLTDKPVRFVVNTHWHGDHTGGNANLADAGVVLVAHDNVRIRMSSEQFIAALNVRAPASPPKALPIVTFTSGLTFHLNGEDIHVVHVGPAHTDGDAIIHFTRANVLHMGDTYFNGRYPLVDLSTGGSFDGLVTAVTTALRYANDSTKVIPGHGPLATRSDLVKYRDMLATIRDRVTALIRQGKSREAVIAAKPTAEWDAALGNGNIKADALVGFAYDSLKPK